MFAAAGEALGLPAVFLRLGLLPLGLSPCAHPAALPCPRCPSAPCPAANIPTQSPLWAAFLRREERSCCARAIPHRRAPSAAAAASVGGSRGEPEKASRCSPLSASQLRCCRGNLGLTALWEHPHRCPPRNSYSNFPQVVKR